MGRPNRPNAGMCNGDPGAVGPPAPPLLLPPEADPFLPDESPPDEVPPPVAVPPPDEVEPLDEVPPLDEVVPPDDVLPLDELSLPDEAPPPDDVPPPDDDPASEASDAGGAVGLSAPGEPALLHAAAVGTHSTATTPIRQTEVRSHPVMSHLQLRRRRICRCSRRIARDPA
ncbi:hypothetical protein ACFXKR_38150 [Streptomyces violascens]|uniref:hypothetical protein n=1 Tax=Streptomyces violascens TaxID=67381 RepID=UPI003692C10B